MARSQYIYLVYLEGGENELLAAFTVKHEAHTWASTRCRWPKNRLELYRTCDGLGDEKQIERIEWDW
jgi:hypothetical protein